MYTLRVSDHCHPFLYSLSKKLVFVPVAIVSWLPLTCRLTGRLVLASKAQWPEIWHLVSWGQIVSAVLLLQTDGQMYLNNNYDGSITVIFVRVQMCTVNGIQIYLHTYYIYPHEKIARTWYSHPSEWPVMSRYRKWWNRDMSYLLLSTWKGPCTNAINYTFWLAMPINHTYLYVIKCILSLLCMLMGKFNIPRASHWCTCRVCALV